jgi:hypothetical protein
MVWYKSVLGSIIIIIIAIFFSLLFFHPYFQSFSPRSSVSRLTESAYITGYVWTRNGFANQKFYTIKSFLLYHISSFFLRLSGNETVKTYESYLVLRHQLIDFLLHDLVGNEGAHMVIELGAGFSPRGMNFTRGYGHQIKYIETDLDAIVRHKKILIKDDLSKYYEIRVVNFLITSGNGSISSLFSEECTFASKPAVVITEGILNHFDKPTLMDMWTRIADNFYKCSQGGVYISDIAILPSDLSKQSLNTINTSGTLWNFFYSSLPRFPFTTPDELKQSLLFCNFQEVTIYQPSQFHHQVDGTSGTGAKYCHILVARVRGRDDGEKMKINTLD